MKPGKTKINTRQVVVNHIDANIIVGQQRLITEYERFNEHLLLMLIGNPDREVMAFSDEVFAANVIIDKLRDIINKNNGK